MTPKSMKWGTGDIAKDPNDPARKDIRPLAERTKKPLCNHPEGALFYYPTFNEAGWKCTDCGEKPGEPPGFSPQHDRKYIWIKVYGLLGDFANSGLISISNGTEADYLSSAIADRCVKENRYDQYSILRFILEEVQPGHARYWTEISEGILAGKDPRNRCHCGKLATSSHYSNGKSEHTCSDHHSYDKFFADKPIAPDEKPIDESPQSGV